MTKGSLSVGAVLTLALAACGGKGGLAPADGGSGHAVSSSDASDATGQGRAGNGGAGAAGIGAAGGAGTGGAAPSPCGAHVARSSVYVSTIGPSSGAVFDGPAVVERNTPTQLTLAFSPAPAPVPSDGGVAAPSLPSHANVIGLGATPLFAVGAKVWLTKYPTGDPPFSPGMPSAGWSLSVLDKKGGRLLFGEAVDARGLIPSSPGASSCTAPYADQCAAGQITYSSTLVQGDTPVDIDDAETRTVRFGGFDYDVTPTSRTITATATAACEDYTVPGGTSVDVRAQDLVTLAAGLEVGAAPACARGNVDQSYTSVSLSEVDVGTTYDGPAVYVGHRFSDDTECFDFRPSGIVVAAGDPPAMLQVCASPGFVKEPAVGQTLWATVPGVNMGALRTAKDGALLLAAVTAFGPFSDVASAVEAMLGVHVDARPGCAYANVNGQVSHLWELVFATTPATVVTSDTRTVVPIGGTDFDVSMWGAVSDAVSFTLAPHS